MGLSAAQKTVSPAPVEADTEAKSLFTKLEAAAERHIAPNRLARDGDGKQISNIKLKIGNFTVRVKRASDFLVDSTEITVHKNGLLFPKRLFSARACWDYNGAEIAFEIDPFERGEWMDRLKAALA